MSRNRVTSKAVALAAASFVLLSVFATPADARFAERRAERSWGSSLDIVERLERMGEFNILLTALETANLKDTLANEGLFTVFAPTDDAFAALLAELGVTPEELLANPDLANILLYHVAPGNLRAGRLLHVTTQETLSSNQPVIVVFEEGNVLVNRSTVTRANVGAKNGVIHVLDTVLLPPAEPIVLESMVDLLRLDGRFSILLAALETTGLDGALADADQLTLFAPTDDAFAALLSDLGVTPEELLANPDLPSILLYHVAEGRKGAARLLAQRSVETLAGASLVIGLRGDGVYVNDSRVVNPNVNAPNGVIHTLDAVLLP